MALEYVQGFECGVCGSRHGSKEAVVDHISDVGDSAHDVSVPGERVQTIRGTVTRESLEAVYVINKHAKRLANEGTSRYRRGDKAGANECSTKKDALYGAKEEFCRETLRVTERVEQHAIDGSVFYCFFYVGPEGDTWSFHVPESNIVVPSEHVVGDVKDLANFTKSAEVTESKLSLSQALIVLKESHGINANDHVSYNSVASFRGGTQVSTFTGWDFLEGASE